jgi:hypothetical protein
MATKAQIAEMKEYQEKLKKYFVGRKDRTVYTNLLHVSRSGMYRVIGVMIMRNNKPIDISGWVAKALGWGYDRDKNGVKVSGAGMDMGFHLVYELSSVLYGYKNRGGYKLEHRWL